MKDKCVLVTGSSSGIGYEITSNLLDLGAKVIGIARNHDKSDLENNLLYLKGSIPGSKNSTVLLRESVKNISRKTIKEKYEAKVKAAEAKKGKK